MKKYFSEKKIPKKLMKKNFCEKNFMKKNFSEKKIPNYKSAYRRLLGYFQLKKLNYLPTNHIQDRLIISTDYSLAYATA